MKSIAIITTHPIQYNAPWFKMLAERDNVKVKVFYTWGQLESDKKFDPGFGKEVKWDIPLLEGYEYSFIKNIAKEPGSHHFKGIDNPTLIKEIEDWNPDALLIFGWSFKSHLKVLRHFKGRRKILFRGDSNLLDEPEGFSIKKTARKIFLKWIYSHVDVALYVGSANRSYYLKYGMQEKQLVFAPHAIDNERFEAGVESGLRSHLGIPGTGVVFLFAGKLEEKKDPHLLLDAFIEMDDPDAYLVMAGNGMLENTLKQRVNALTGALQSRIHFTGFKNQQAMPAVYKTGDVLVLPSKGPGETWGLAVNEAMASGRAVLVSDKCGCYTDLVQVGRNGYVFRVSNREDLAAKMKMMMKHRSKLPAMGRASAEIISDWNYSRICEAIENII